MISNGGNGDGEMMDHDVHGNRIVDPVTKRDLRGGDYVNDYNSVLSSVSNAVEPAAAPDTFEPTDADVRHLAAAMLAGAEDCLFTEATQHLGRMSKRQQEKLLRAARAAFDHPGYLPSINAARQDVAACRIAFLETELLDADNKLGARIAALEADLRISKTRTYIAEGRVRDLELIRFMADPTASDLPDPAKRPDGTLAPQPKPWTPPKANGDARRIGG